MSTEEHYFRPGAKADEPVARSGGPGGGGTLCLRPGDNDDELMARRGGPGGGGYACFHPGDNDDQPMASRGGPGGSCCFHPGDEGGAPMARLADDLAADLHLALTSIDDRQLAVLA